MFVHGKKNGHETRPRGGGGGNSENREIREKNKVVANGTHRATKTCPR